jgi:hypothetical protein
MSHSNNNLQRPSSHDAANRSNGNIFLLRLKSIMVYSFPLAVYIITSGEFAMLIFYQFYFYDYDSNLLGLSVFLQIISLLYFISMFIYMFYSINYRYKNATPEELDKFSLLHVFFKENDTMSRNYFLFTVIRKIATSMVLVFVYASPKAQIVIIFLLYFVFACYVFLVRPFKERKYMIFSIVCEAIMLLIHLIFLLMVCDNKVETQDNYSSAILALIIILFIIQFLFSIVQLVIAVWQLISKPQ